MYVDIYQAIIDNIHPAGFVDPPMPTLWEIFLTVVQGFLTSGSAYFSGSTDGIF
ncbi:hypothetical protein [Rhodococcus sp. O3]|uniref:hypothetical protein n=1 Tax=Rhodococcus sp. O3 TaxID=3404919 RepID=UPI003B67F2C5